MRSRMTKLGAAIAALAALAVGGSAFASAAQKTGTATKPAAKVTTHVTAAKAETPDPGESQGADSDNVQQGDQSGTDAAESAGETGSSDGPGGYADTAANADTQQQGEH